MKIRPKKNNCPYCAFDLGEKPPPKYICPNCDQDLFLRNNKLVTADQAQEFDFLKKVEHLGVTKKDYYTQKRRLSKEFGKEASSKDVILGVYDQLILSFNEKQEFQTLQTIYLDMALILAKEGNDKFKEMLKQKHRMELLRHQQKGTIKRVKIFDRNDPYVCTACRKLNQQSFTLEEALEHNPLPCKDCTGVMDKAVGYCRCMYKVEIEN